MSGGSMWGFFGGGFFGNYFVEVQKKTNKLWAWRL